MKIRKQTLKKKYHQLREMNHMEFSRIEAILEKACI